MPISTVGYAAMEESGALQLLKFEHRDLGPNDVHIRIVACGVCRTDVHFVNNLFRNSAYPLIPGHEITGYVEAIGEHVTKVVIEQKVGVGIIIDSCLSCDKCNDGNVQYCNDRVMIGSPLVKDGSPSYGGYARDVVCNEKFVIPFPDTLDLYEGAPLLCGGITIYAPIRKYAMDKPGKKMGVVGLGGLGHMAVKIGVALGLDVTVISSPISKREKSKGILGAHNFINLADKTNLAAAKNSLDVIINTAVGSRDMQLYMSLLVVGGIIVMIGRLGNALQFNELITVDARRILTASMVGSIAETEDFLKFAVENQSVIPVIEKIPMDYVNTAWKLMMNTDAPNRYVLDIENSYPKL